MRLHATENEEEAGINMAPLIDCVFILLIFFLVTSMMQKPHKDLGIVLPEAASAEEATADYDTVIVELTAPRPPDGRPVIVMDGEEVTQTVLHQRLRRMALENPNRKVRLDADREASVYDISRIMDQLQFVGLTDIGWRTQD
ncbi:MAG: ExbD/TolR family protein [Phycisphaerae bacterium]